MRHALHPNERLLNKAPVAEGAASVDRRGGSERVVICAECGHELTRVRRATERQGAHRHRFTNPFGLVFELRLFLDARGLVPIGQPTERWSWFPGHAWRIGLCKACSAHVGWEWRAGRTSFVGLVTERIEERHLDVT